MTFVSFNSNLTSVTCGTGTDDPSGPPEFSPKPIQDRQYIDQRLKQTIINKTYTGQTIHRPKVKTNNNQQNLYRTVLLIIVCFNLWSMYCLSCIGFVDYCLF
jgi:hypothetical protein